MKTIRTAVLDELYEHVCHILQSQEGLGVDPETGKHMNLEWVSVKRDEGRLLVKVLVAAPVIAMTNTPVHRELIITVEKS